MALLLIGHEADELLVLWSDTGSSKVLWRERGESVVEQIELNPLLV